jgi:hypothetical protein
MNRDQIIEANPLPDFLRARGAELKPAGPNFGTNVCPKARHKNFHRPVNIDTASRSGPP